MQNAQPAPLWTRTSVLFITLITQMATIRLMSLAIPAHATPANKAALVRYYGRFLPRRLDSCSACHLPANSNSMPTSLKEFPHNPFGKRLREVGLELVKQGKKADIAARLRAIAKEDSDGDGVGNEAELLLGHAPGDSADRPSASEMLVMQSKQLEFARYLSAYRWQPFEAVKRPPVPKAKDLAWEPNPIDAFL